MYRNIYSSNAGVQAANWYKKNNLSSKGYNKALEKWHFMRLQYRHQFDLFKKILGVGLIIVSTTSMVLNEKRAVENSQTYQEGLRLVHLVTNPHEIFPENDGKLVHVSGYLSIPEVLEDYPYGVSIYAVKLKRRIQIFQWDEDKVQQVDDFGQPQYQYTKGWRDKLIDSKNFVHPTNHQNPRHMPVKSEVRLNKLVQVGSFELGQELKDKFNDFTQFTSGERPESSNLKMHMGLYYHATDIWNPSVGDLRIQFAFAGPADSFVSIIAKQSGSTLLPFEMTTGQSILYLHEGNKNHYDIFTKEHSSHIFYIWIFRTSTWTSMALGFFLTAKMVPLMSRRQMLKNFIRLEPMKLSLILTSFLSLLTMGCVWCQYKPFFGFLLISLSGCVIVYYVVIPADPENSLLMYSKSKKDTQKAPPSSIYNDCIQNYDSDN